MKTLELVSFNIGVPGIEDEIVLESLAAGLAILIERHKVLGVSFTDTFMQEHARLTIADHICELIGEHDDKLFSWVYNAVIDQLEIILATYWLEMEEFTMRVDKIADIMSFWYPGLIRLCVNENEINANGNSELHLS